MFGSVDVSFNDIGAGFIASAGNAMRAEVRAKDGRGYPALLVNGDL